MEPYPLRLIAVSYVVSGLLGVAAGMKLGWWMGLMVAWLGGPLVVLTLPNLPLIGWMFARRHEPVVVSRMREADYRAWERDLEAEAEEAAAAIVNVTPEPVRRAG